MKGLGVHLFIATPRTLVAFWARLDDGEVDGVEAGRRAAFGRTGRWVKIEGEKKTILQVFGVR
jgi:hypothetical protein